jgi:hypothetical protein
MAHLSELTGAGREATNGNVGVRGYLWVLKGQNPPSRLIGAAGFLPEVTLRL